MYNPPFIIINSSFWTWSFFFYFILLDNVQSVIFFRKLIQEINDFFCSMDFFLHFVTPSSHFSQHFILHSSNLLFFPPQKDITMANLKWLAVLAPTAISIPRHVFCGRRRMQFSIVKFWRKPKVERWQIKNLTIRRLIKK